MYAIRNGLGPRWAWLGTMFAVFGGLAGFGIGNMVQSNSIAARLDTSYALDQMITGLVLMVITGAVSWAESNVSPRCANWLVPFMGIVYVLAALWVLAFHWRGIPASAGVNLQDRIHGHSCRRRICRCNDDGRHPIRHRPWNFFQRGGARLGRHRAAAAQTNDPVRSGLIRLMGTFLDTVVICAMTGLALVVSGACQWAERRRADEGRVPSAIPGVGGGGHHRAAIFAHSTILGWSYYGERCWQFLVGSWTIKPYRILWTIAVFFGAITHLDLAWTIADTLNALMAIPNLIALLALSPVVVQLTRVGLARALQD